MTHRTPPAVLSEFISAISQASGAAWQLIHSRHRVEFMPIRDRLEMIKSKCLKLAVNTKHQINS